MGKRISEKAWHVFIEANPDAAKEITSFNVKFDRQNVFPNFYKYRKKQKCSKSNTERFGIELGPALDWLDDNTNEEYYVMIDRASKGYRIMEVTFFFCDDGDAMAFKLIIGEKT